MGIHRKVSFSMKVVCDGCGEEFTANTHHVRFCRSCRAKMAKIYGRINRTVSLERRDEVALQMLKDEVARAREERKSKGHHNDGPKRRCKYCGSTWNADSGFCTTCRREGLDAVYAVTGRSNGWERKCDAPVKVVGGWRGQNRPGCGGAGMSIYKFMGQKAFDTP